MCVFPRVREWPSWFLFLATPIVKSTVTVVQLTDFVEIAAMRQFDRVLARVECMRPGSLADKAQSDGRRVMLPARSSRTEAAGGARAGVRRVQIRGVDVFHVRSSWSVAEKWHHWHAAACVHIQWANRARSLAVLRAIKRPKVGDNPFQPLGNY